MDHCGHQGGERAVLSVHLCVVVKVEGGKGVSKSHSPRLGDKQVSRVIRGKGSRCLSLSLDTESVGCQVRTHTVCFTVKLCCHTVTHCGLSIL